MNGPNAKGTSRLWSTNRLFTTGEGPTGPGADSQKDSSYEEDIRRKILEASLGFVPQLGWSKEAVRKGAEAVGYPGISHGMFIRGGGDLIHYFQSDSNMKLVDLMKQMAEETKEKPLSPADFAEKAMQERLKMIVPFLSKWPQAIAIQSLPPNVPKALANLLTLCDDICYYAGDRSVDINWYLRRLGIAGVYKATELYMIQDKSQEFKDTWLFLNRRLSEAVQLHDMLITTEGGTQGAKDAVQSVFVTARNILGLNWNR